MEICLHVFGFTYIHPTPSTFLLTYFLVRRHHKGEGRDVLRHVPSRGQGVLQVQGNIRTSRQARNQVRKRCFLNQPPKYFTENSENLT